MTEKDSFIQTLEGKSYNTIKTYLRFYNKIIEYFDKPVSDTSQSKLIELSDTFENLNSKQGILNIAILVRRLKDLSTKELEEKRELNKGKLVKHVKESNAKLNLPSYQDLIEYLDYLYASEKYNEFIINFLLMNGYVRNEDLNVKLIKLKRDATDDSQNYLWLSKNNDKVTYIRNNYKTVATYGQKQNTFTDKRLIESVKKLKQTNAPLIPNPDQVGYYVQKATLNKIGEGSVLKIILSHYSTNLSKLKEISKSRGTSLATLASSYNIALD